MRGVYGIVNPRRGYICLYRITVELSVDTESVGRILLLNE